jgi:hypothetical protein
MNKLHFSIAIDAPKEKDWHTMLDRETYPQWTIVFTPGSHYVGDWNQGSKIQFLGPDKDGITEVSVDMDSNDEYEEMFRNTWPKALQRLKELAEK